MKQLRLLLRENRDEVVFLAFLVLLAVMFIVAVVSDGPEYWVGTVERSADGTETRTMRPATKEEFYSTFKDRH